MTFSVITGLASLAIVVFAWLHLRGAYQGNKLLFYVFKPLTTLSIAALCWYLAPTLNSYVYLILLGLLLSTLGDIFLMLPKDRFIPGLASFLLAHLAYIVAFANTFTLTYSIVIIVPLALLSIIVLTILWPYLAAMKLPVAVYLTIIVAMAWLSAERYLDLGDNASLYACIGEIGRAHV